MFEEYWIGKGVDYLGAWDDFDRGGGYIEKFSLRTVHVLQLEFERHPEELPLFDHEAILKTVKGCFHDLKQQNLSHHEYNEAVPIFLYDIRRGSAVWNFLGELRQLLMFGTTLSDEKLKNQRLDNWDKKLAILDRFGQALSPDDAKKLMNADAPDEVDRAMKRLIRQGLKRVKISERAFDGDIDYAESNMIDLKLLTGENDNKKRMRPRAIGERDEED